jgi:hypothetical protein
MLTLVAALLASAATAPRLPSRFTVPTIIVNRNAEVASDLLVWKDLLQSDLNALATGGLSMLTDAGRIRFAKREVSDMPSLTAIADRWRQENAIQVISAAGFRQSGGSTVLEGSIYLGDLAGTLPGKTVILPPTINAASYQSSRDIVKTTMLYALAVDAGNYKPAACPLLYRAGQVRNDLVRRRVDVGGLAAAIDRRLAALKCAVSR